MTSPQTASPPTNGQILDGMTAIVTGAAGGIGGAIASAFAEAGAHLVVTDLHADGLAALVDGFGGAGGDVLSVPADLTDENAVDALYDAAASRWERVDLLVNCAGVSQIGSILDVGLAEWRRVFAANVEAPLLMSRQAVRRMLQQEPNASGCRGKLINVSSNAAEHGRPVLPAYGASKAALNHLSKTLAAAYGSELISTTVLYPGNVMEGMWKDLAIRLAAAEGRPVAAVIAEREFQSPNEVGRTALYIAAARGMRLNGQRVTSEPAVSPL